MVQKLPYIAVFDVIGWADLRVFPTIEQRNKNYICLEYAAENKVALLDWIHEVQQKNIDDDVEFCAIIVFADFKPLSSGYVAELVGDFTQAGAMLSDFPKGVESFYDALVDYNETVQNAKLHNAKYAAEREKLLAKNLA